MSKSKYTALAKTFVKLAWSTSAYGGVRVAPLLNTSGPNENAPSDQQEEKLSKYWPANANRTLENILAEADKLYGRKKYIEVYEMLNRLKYNNHACVKWRIARVLYQTTVDNALKLEMEKEIIKEAYELLKEEATEDNRNSDIHKWFAIICDSYNRLQGLEKRIHGYHTVLKHLRIAYGINPDDITVCYLLGKLCFNMADLQGFKRYIVKTLYAEPPECSFEEAHMYLCRVEELSERSCIVNLHLLGRTYYKLNQFYKAKHYLGMACCVNPKSDMEKKEVCKAKQLLSKLERYSLDKQALFLDYDNLSTCDTEDPADEIKNEDVKSDTSMAEELLNKEQSCVDDEFTETV